MSAQHRTAAPRTSGSLARSRPRYGEFAVKVVLLLAALVSVLTTVGIVVALLEPTIEFFSEVGLGEFFGSTTWGPLFNPPAFGVWPIIVATLEITLIAIVVAVPLGLASAIYLSEYATPRVRKVLKPVLEVLAGVPTVVFGFFALTFVTPLLQDVFPFLGLDGKNALSAGLLVGVMIIPIVASLSEDSMAAVPNGLREGSYALGASKMITSVRVVVPAAFSGIVAAIILAVSRAAGETMIVAIAGGFKSVFTLNPANEMATMAAFIAQAGSGDASVGSTAYKTIFAVGSLLFVMTFAMNYLSARMVQKYREVYD
ncbi:phosphate ABC transporter permease subunit PstC [Planomonospora sp. ID91781]|uniref:Phosphate transport system permease protein n=1 Tax=Planomonospora sphaerica TaxID=161355 RepID=A0A171D709_9ACTN|nr:MULTISPECIES: phosphate ABC transporter permease subunit PstC [Planomonospora]MBG0825542.1 phosphate ABC transporter permease subunit PstC [Planomonospora sp. ID91781]GAT67740.1 phosphate ABC transporter permease [Planomonospora sphaerica]